MSFTRKFMLEGYAREFDGLLKDTQRQEQLCLNVIMTCLCL